MTVDETIRTPSQIIIFRNQSKRFLIINRLKTILVFQLIVCILLSIIGCQTNRTIISFSDNGKRFSIVGYGKQAPFSPDPNFYCYLVTEPNGFVSDQIDSVIAFRKINGESNLIYNTINQDRILISNKNDLAKSISRDQMTSLNHKIQSLKSFDIQIIN